MRKPMWRCRVVSFVLLIVFVGSAWAGVCKGSKVPKVEIAGYDAQADLASADHDMGTADSTDCGGVAGGAAEGLGPYAEP